MQAPGGRTCSHAHENAFLRLFHDIFNDCAYFLQGGRKRAVRSMHAALLRCLCRSMSSSVSINIIACLE